MNAMRTLAIAVLLTLAGCASGGGAKTQVNAVVEDEHARQAAAAAAAEGKDSADSLKAAADETHPPEPAPGPPPS
jgi:hypothetical protein